MIVFWLLPQQADELLCDLIGWDGIGRSHGIEVYAESPRFCGKLGSAAQPQYALSGQMTAQKIARGQSRRALITDYRQPDRYAVPQGIGKPNVAAPVGCIGKYSTGQPHACSAAWNCSRSMPQQAIFMQIPSS